MDNILIEISIAFNDEDLEHEGYYDSIDAAIDALNRLKEELQ